MATLAAQALQADGAQDITFMNRTYTRAETLANRAGGKALSWHHFREALASFDVIVSVTGAPHTVIYSDDVEEAIPERAGRPLTLVDIAVPRDVEAKTRDLPGVQLFDIDDLQSMVDKHKSIREAAIPAVDAIIDEEVSSFFDWLNSRQITPIISDLREWAQSLAQAEVEQALNRLDERDQHIEEVVSRLAHRLVNKILHEPTVRLKAQAAQGNGQDYADAVRELFDLTASDSSNNGNTGD
jgi:glutamyl-tRNA reductase